MKKFLLIFLSFLIVIGVAGCSRPPEDTKPEPSVNPPAKPGDGEDGAFTVQLFDVDLEVPFGVYEDDGTTALFTSKEDGSVKEVPFDVYGVARTEELDGDYMVTINSLADGYAYNPNIYTVTNDNRNITINIYTLLKSTGTGTGWFGNVLNLPKAGGIYRIQLDSLSHGVYCQFRPGIGEYYIESLCDITANEINPRMTVYEANGGWVSENVKQYIDYTEDAARSNFTKNFRYKLSAYSNTFVCAFKLTCDSRVGYPAYVDLYVARASDYDFGEDIDYKMYMPAEDFKQTQEYDTQFKFIANDDPHGVLRGEYVQFNAVDGYYHYIKGGVNKILYVKLSGPIICPNGYAVLNLQDKPLDQPDIGDDQRYWQTYFYLNGKNYNFMIQGFEGLVNAKYEDAERYRNKESYIDYVNSDGVYAVTAELKEFLQAYAVTMQLFYDGTGTAEYDGYNSNDANQWLFACGYYL